MIYQIRPIKLDENSSFELTRNLRFSLLYIAKITYFETNKVSVFMHEYHRYLICDDKKTTRSQASIVYGDIDSFLMSCYLSEIRRWNNKCISDFNGFVV